MNKNYLSTSAKRIVLEKIDGEWKGCRVAG